MNYYNPYYQADYNNHYYHYGQFQAQTQSNKQLISLRQDQHSSNTIMCRILSELENLAFFLGYNGPRLFGYYATNPNNFDDIIKQIMFQMTLFESSYYNFKKKNPNKQYEFPNNLSFTNIINIVNQWKNSIKNNKAYESYFNEFLNILSNNHLSKNFNNQFQNIDKDSPKITNEELRRIMNAGTTAACYTNEKYNEIEKEINEKGDYKVNVVLGRERKDNQFYFNMDQYDKTFEIEKKEFDKILHLMLGYLELYVLSKANQNNNIPIKYSKKITKKNGDYYSQYSKYLDELDNIYDKLYKDFSYVISDEEKKIYEEDLKIMKKNTNDSKVKKECYYVIEFICNNKPLNK
jgi:hypothetical protein